MIELVMTISVIGILIAWTTVYLWWSGDKRKIIEAQWCAATIWWELNNFIFYALTSKELNSTIWAPDYYRIWLNGWTSNSQQWTHFINSSQLSFNDCTRECNYGNGCIESREKPILCEKINLNYKKDKNSNEETYKELSAPNTCKQYNTKIRFMRKVDGERESSAQGQGHGRPSNIAYININKWFTQWWINDTRVFYMQNADTWKTPLLWSIFILVCLDNDCKTTKEIWKYDIDWRTQTISLNKCAFYKDDAPDTTKNEANECQTRENEQKIS